jgi:hypothetical protein
MFSRRPLAVMPPMGDPVSLPVDTLRYHGRPGEVAEWLKAAPC